MSPRPPQPGTPPAPATRRWRLTASPVDPVAAFWGALVLAMANATVSASTHVETHANPLVRLGLWVGANAVAVVLFTLGCMLVRSFQRDAPPSSSPKALATSYAIYLWLGLLAGAARYELMLQAGLHAPPDSVLGSLLAHAGNLGSGALLVGLAVNQYHGFLHRAQDQQRALEAQVTRLEAAVAARAEAEARLASLTAAIPDAVVIVDDADRVVLWSEGAERTLGYSAAEALGQPTSLFVPARLRERYVEQVASAVGPVTWEMTAVRKGGEEFPIAVSLAFWESGGRRWLGAIARDITGAQESRERESRDQRLAALGQLAAGMAHDFRNVLTSILTAGSLLREVEEPEGRARLLDLVERSGREGAALANRVLEFSRRNPLALAPVDLRELLREALPGFAQQVREGVSVRLEPGQGPVWVAADAPLLRQALANLVRNASDAMPQGGQVTLRLSGRTPPAVEAGDGGWASVEVEDQGHGMPSEVLERLFEPYFTTKPRGLGTGLGLAQAFGIAREHRGELWAESPAGGGALVCLSLPLLAQDATAEAHEAAPAVTPALAQAPSVLVTEDDTAVRAMLRQWLHARGCAVAEAGSGEEALALLREGAAPDVLLTDIAMPGMDGAELARQATALRPGLRVIVLTGYQLGPEAIGVEGAAVLRKPPDLGRLAALLGVEPARL